MVKQNRNNLSPEIGGNICLKLMFLFLAIIPFGFAYFTISHSLFSMYYEAGFITFLSVLILVTIGLIAVVMPEKMSKTKRIGALTAMFCASLIVRIFVINLLQTTPYSDFGRCYAYATGEQVADLDILINYPYLGAYAVLLKIVFAFFPVSVFTAQIVNSIATSCIPILLFLGTEKMTSKSRIAWVAGLTYAFYPGLIIYNAVTSCEHFSQFFFALGFYMLACERTSLTEQKRKRMIAYIGGAVAFGLMCLFKELFVILAPAILMMGFCYDVIPKIVRKVKEHLPNAGIIRSILKNVVFVLIVFCVYKCFVMAVQMEIGGTIVDRNDPISVPIYRGLTPSAKGIWNEDVNEICYEVRAQSSSNSEVNRILLQKLLSEYNGNYKMFLDVIKSKLETDFCNEGVYWYWTFNESGNILQRTWMGEVYFSLFPSAFFMVMCGIMMVRLIVRAFRKTEGRELEFFVTGIVFLFVLILILMEAQGRYKSNIMPYACILFALSIDTIIETLKSLKSKFSKSLE